MSFYFWKKFCRNCFRPGKMFMKDMYVVVHFLSWIVENAFTLHTHKCSHPSSALNPFRWKAEFSAEGNFYLLLVFPHSLFFSFWHPHWMIHEDHCLQKTWLTQDWTNSWFFLLSEERCSWHYRTGGSMRLSRI